MWVWAGLYTLFGIIIVPVTRAAKRKAQEISVSSISSMEKLPSVSLIKPVRGVSEFSQMNFRSWLSQEYPNQVQFIFSFQDKNDPGIGIVESLRSEFPLQIIVNEIREGFSGKSSNLFYGVQASEGEFLILSDADIFAHPDTIREIVIRAKRGKSIVSCLPIHTASKGVWAGLYKMIWNSTLVGLWAPAMYIKKAPGVAGGTVGFWRVDLEKIGGISSFANYVAEDLKMGSLFKNNGYNLELGPIVESKVGHITFRNYWNAIMRAAFVSWNAENGGKFKSVLLHTFAYGYVPSLIYGLAIDHQFIAPSLFMLFIRISLLTYFAFVAEGRIRVFLLTPISDFLSTLALIVSLLKRELRWAEVTYRVEDDGQLINIS